MLLPEALGPETRMTGGGEGGLVTEVLIRDEREDCIEFGRSSAVSVRLRGSSVEERS